MTALAKILASIAVALLDYLAKKYEQPKIISDAQTPDDIRNGWHSYLNARLSNKGGNSSR